MPHRPRDLEISLKFRLKFRLILCESDSRLPVGPYKTKEKGKIMKNKKFRFSAVMSAVFGLTLLMAANFGGSAGCGSEAVRGATGGTGTGDLASVNVSETSSSGDFTPAASFFATDGGGIGFNVSGADINGDGTVGSPTVSNVSVEAGDTIALGLGTKRVSISDCESRDVGTGSSDDIFDIAVSLDTTASMGTAAGLLAGKIAEFASSLAASGINAQFAGITVGDAFATKLADGSSFTDAVSEGSLGEPPSWDSCERPDTGTALLSDTDMATFFTEVETAVGSGCSGNGGVENYLGPVELANDSLAWRDGATRIIIGIGDNCAYNPDTASEDFIVDPWTPPDPSAMETALSGVATFHWIGNPEEDTVDADGMTTTYGMGCADSGYYNMKDLSDATGGTFTEIGTCGGDAADCNVDLTALPILSTITSGTRSECNITAGSDLTFTICFDVAIEDADANYCAVLTVTVTD